MAASRPLHVARTRRCDVPEGAPLARPEEVTEVLRCLRESLREPAMASALALFVSSSGRDEQREDTRDFASGAFNENGEG